ncbi:MAG TPA: type II toxin-antitoxin system RelE/ParE family toxin [Candidatus Obscuribacterales bacterium]
MDHLDVEVRIYQLPDGRVPYLEWLEGLKDQQARQRIQARFARIRLGNFGQTRSVGGGVHELKVDYGPGYRVYFGRDGQHIVILLCGGDKGTQDEDITKARTYWENYKRERKNADG